MVLAGQTQPEHVEMGTAPGEPGRTRALPHININDLTGSWNTWTAAQQPRRHLRHRPGAQGRLRRSPGLTEAAELLGFANIAEGDITLNPLGEPSPRPVSGPAKKSSPPGFAACLCLSGSWGAPGQR